MRRILVPVDGSETSLRGLRLAALRAKQAQAEVHVLHVEPPMAYVELRVYVVRPELEKVRQEACRRVLDAAAAVMTAEGIAHAEHLEHGEVGQTVARFAAEHAIDEIVMGTRGLGAIGGMLMGSVAQRVVHLAAVPVTLVK